VEQRSIKLLAAGIVAVGVAGLIVYAGLPRDAPASRAGARPRDAGSQPAPREVFARAKVGDWYAYRVETVGPAGDVRATAVKWISAVMPDTVTRSVRGRVDATGEERAGRPETFPRAGHTRTPHGR